MNSIGVDFKLKNIEIDNKKIKLQIWDTAGQENFRSVTRGYYKASAVAMVVYDITKEESFEHIQTWLKDCKELAPRTVLLVLIGNKTDLEDQRVITKERGEKLAKENNMIFLETSALNGNGIKEAFQKSIEAVDQKIRSGYYDLSDSSKQGIKKIIKDNDNNYGERIVDKKSLSLGKKPKDDNLCCL